MSRLVSGKNRDFHIYDSYSKPEMPLNFTLFAALPYKLAGKRQYYSWHDDEWRKEKQLNVVAAQCLMG